GGAATVVDREQPLRLASDLRVVFKRQPIRAGLDPTCEAECRGSPWGVERGSDGCELARSGGDPREAHALEREPGGVEGDATGRCAHHNRDDNSTFEAQF